MTDFRMPHSNYAMKRMNLPRGIGDGGVIHFAAQHHHQFDSLRVNLYCNGQRVPSIQLFTGRFRVT